MQNNFTVLTSAILAAALCIVQQDVVAQTVNVIKIGFSSPLTGPQASAGQDNLGGLQMAVEQLNAKGMSLAGQKVRFEIVSQDDQGDPKTGVAVAQALVDAGVKAVIGPYNSGVTIPASKVYNDAGVVMATVASNPKVTQQGYSHVFRVAASDIQLGSAMAAYAAHQLHVRTVAVVDDRTAYGQGLAAEFARVARLSGLTIAGNFYTSDKASDFSAILTAIKAKRPDAIFFGGYSAQGGPMLRQMKQLGVSSLLLGGDGICAPELARLAGDALGSQVYCTQGGTVPDRMAAGKQFAADYQQRFKRPAETYAASFYDGMMLVAQAMQQANSADPARYRPVLEKISYKGVTGSFAFDARHDLQQSPVTVFHFAGGQPVPLATD